MHILAVGQPIPHAVDALLHHRHGQLRGTFAEVWLLYIDGQVETGRPELICLVVVAVELNHHSIGLVVKVDTVIGDTHLFGKVV